MSEPILDEISSLKTQYIEGLIDEIVAVMEFKDYVSSPLSPPIPAETVKKDFKESLKKTVEASEEHRRIQEGMKIIEANLHTLPEEQICRNDLQQAADSYMKNYLQLLDQANDGLSGKETEDFLVSNEMSSLVKTLKISAKTCAAFYRIGCNCYEQKQFDEATSVFQFLSVLDPFCKQIWCSFGMCQQVLKNYTAAVSSYSMAILLDPYDPLLYLYSAECCLASSDQKNALGYLELAEHFNSLGSYKAIERKIESLKKAC